jgi:hypothetical protein
MATVIAVLTIVGVSAGAAWLCRVSLRSVSYAAPPIEGVVDRHRASLLDLPGVLSVGVGEAEGVACILVTTRALTAHESSSIPATVDGWHVRQETVDERRGPGRPRITPASGGAPPA